MLVKLREAIGSIQPSADDVLGSESDTSIVRRALLVYAGLFESLDGPVEVTKDQLVLLVGNHNSLLARAKRLVSGTVPLKSYPPIQLDHSTSARDTVGRLTGELELGVYDLDGVSVSAVYGHLTVLGRDNVERVKDGRWTHLSIGADFEAGALRELTITPFPAAAGASLLSSGNTGDKPPLEPKDEPKTAEELSVNKERLKKHLMECKKMSESEADSEMARLSLEDKKDELSKLSADCDAEDKRLSDAETEKTEVAAKLTAARAKITNLSGGFGAAAAGARLAARQGSILTRLSALRAEAKITPAEIKKLDIAKLSAQPESAIELVLKTFGDRDPQVLLGQYGSARDVQIGSVAAKAKADKLYEETRRNMSLLAQSDAHSGTRLAEGGGVGHQPSVTEAAAANAEELAAVDAELAEIAKAGGSVAEAQTRLRAFLVRCVRLGGIAGGGDYLESNSVETQKQLAEMSANVTKMQAQFDELHALASSLVG